MRGKYRFYGLVITAVCITVIEVVALIQKLDGQLFLSSLSALVGIFGYFLGRRGERHG